MKKKLYLLILAYLSTMSVVSQDAEKTVINSSPIWGEFSVGIGKIKTPLFAGTDGSIYLKDQFSSGYNLLMMYELPKTWFSIGGSLWYNRLDTQLQEPTFIPSRFLIGPAAAFKVPVMDKGVFYITTTAGLKWDVHRNELPSGYLFCQPEFSIGGNMSVSYAFRSRIKLLDGMGIKGTIYSYGNSREAHDIKLKNPLVDGWEISLCWYLSPKK